MARAKAALDVHAFIGLTEAYDSSVKLALHTFGLEAVPGDFAHLRVKKGPKCQGAAAHQPAERERLLMCVFGPPRTRVSHFGQH